MKVRVDKIKDNFCFITGSSLIKPFKAPIHCDMMPQNKKKNLCVTVDKSIIIDQLPRKLNFIIHPVNFVIYNPQQHKVL